MNKLQELQTQAIERLNVMINSMRVDGYSVRVLAESTDYIRIDTPRGEIFAHINPLLGSENYDLEETPYAIIYQVFRTGEKFIGYSAEDFVDMIRGTYSRRRV